jgi:hypothetical protein
MRTTLRIAAAAALPALVVGGIQPGPAPATGTAPRPPFISVGMPMPAVEGYYGMTDTVYPRRDGYGDGVAISVVHDHLDWDADSALVTIRSRSGRVVMRRTIRPEIGGQYLDSTPWRGRRHGDILPEGWYRIAATVFGEEGQVEKATPFQIRVSHAKKTYLTYRRTITPARSVIDKQVGRCARLRRPARSDWPGSFGYRSRAGCGPQRSLVATIHRISVPKSVFACSYRDVVLTVHGGRAAGGARRSYLYVAHLNYHGEWSTEYYLDGRLGRHRGVPSENGVAVRGTGCAGDYGRPHTIWTVGIAGGADFNVRKFVVTVRWAALRK